jgi:hypothetical protein
LNKDHKEDIRTWLQFLDHFNGVSIFSDQYWLSNHDLDLYSDAAGNRHLGFGAYMNGEWIIFKWPMLLFLN